MIFMAFRSFRLFLHGFSVMNKLFSIFIAHFLSDLECTGSWSKLQQLGVVIWCLDLIKRLANKLDPAVKNDI
ncbi:hypothetical protein SDJN02_22651 [Cucurbita argyrosperma subsp. argyrosperma]|nr:hypothetical protein SDJN02_22651 [Cucurbita argyrosperma subsp. argyrosperma]